MNRSLRRWAAAAAAAVMVVMLAVGFGWACVGLVSLTTGSPTVPPGGKVTVTGREFAQGAPVDIHLDSSTGPVLVTVPPPSTTMTSKFTVDVPIPADVPNGQHVLVATQQYHNMNAGIPARAIVYVGAAAPAPPVQAALAPRPAAVTASSGPSALSLALIGLSVAAAGLLLAGAWSLVAARRPPRTAPEGTKAS